jgi:lysophospholipid acyltransferase (LPLAT)-like uncharacterized protein
MSDRLEIRESRKAVVVGTLAGWLMRFWSMTLRLSIEDRWGGKGIPSPVILCLWHSRIFVGPFVWRKLTEGRRPMVVLTSASHDGAMLARAMGVFGVGAVRGSSSRRAVAALVAMRKALKEGVDCCVTPDGPRGPRYVMQAGLLKLAESSGAKVLPMHVTYGKAWRLKSWDRFVIPAPFSRVRVVFDEALAVPAKLSDDDFERWRVRIEEVLRAGVDDFSPNE